MFGKNYINFVILFFVICTSCAAQKAMASEEEMIYDLIKYHYHLDNKNYSNEFLYYKTMPVRNNSLFSWISETSLSEFLNDPIFPKNCRRISELFTERQIEKMNHEFADLQSIPLNEKKFSQPILSQRFLQKETYNEIPNAAVRKITYPILINGKGHIYAIFAEDAHNEGGRLYIYKLSANQWELICRDQLWFI